MKKTECNKSVGRGRPRAFDPDKALETAMQLFWRKGYEGTSLSDLTEAIGINRPSLYAVFGNKEELFHRAFERYLEDVAPAVLTAQQKPTAREAVEAYFCLAVTSLTQGDHPGCLSVVGALVCSEEGDNVRQALCATRQAGQVAWRKRFERARAEGDLPDDTDPDALAHYVMTVANGMSVQARSGATREDLRHVAEIALRAFPH